MMSTILKFKKFIFFSLFVIVTLIFSFVVKNALAATLFSDNFDDNSIDTSKWTELDPVDYITETGGKITLSDSGAWGTTALFSTTTFPRAASTTFLATVNLSFPYVAYGFKGNVTSSSYSNLKYGIYFYDATAGGGGNRQLIVYEDGSSKGEKGLGWSLGTDYRIAIMMKSAGALYYIQGGIYGTLGSDDWTILYDSVYSSAGTLTVGFTAKDDGNTSTIMTMDDVSVVDTALPISVIIKNKMISKPIDNGITLLFKTNVTANMTLEYGLTDSYGSTVTTSNQTMHEINLTGLAAATTYHYRATFAENANTSNTTTTLDTTFKTRISSTTSFVAGMITDTQGCNFSNVVTQLETLDPDILLSTGDNMMGESATTVGTFRYRWGIDFFDYMQTLTNHIPLYTAFGNHDGVVSSYIAGSNAYNAELAMPTSTPGGELYYSFDYGPAHFVVLNGSTATSGIQGIINDTQLAWLDADLASTTQPYKIVLGHYMVYGWDDTEFFSSTTWRYSNFEAVHTILNNNNVLAYIGGHRHTYNRYVKDGVYYITNPAAGSEWCTLDPAEYGPGNYANVGGDTGTIANAIGYYPGYTKLSVSASRVSAITYKDDGTTLADYDLTPTNFELSTPSDSGSISDTTPTLTWNASSDNAAGISKYQIYVDGVLALDNIPSSTVSTDLTTPLADGAHTWYVKAVNAAGWATQSNSTFTLNLDSTAPSSPGPLTTSTISMASVVLSFGATSTDSSFSQYKIFYKAGSSGVSESDTEINSSTDSNLGNVNFNAAVTTTITGLATGTQYVANIWVYDTGGNNVSSTGEITFYTLADTPGTITTNGVTANEINLTLDFATNDAPSTTTLYNICKTDDATSCAASGYLNTDTTLGSGPNWYTADQLNQGFPQVSGLTPSTTYQFIVQARNGDGVTTTFSSASTVTTTLSAQPVSPTVSAITTTTLTLSWGDNTNPASVEYRVSGTGITTTSTTATSSVLLEGLTPNAPFTISVESKNSSGSYNAAVAASLIYTSSTNPTSLTVTSSSTTSMVLQWNTNGSATSTVYKITGDNSFTTAYVTSTDTGVTITTTVSGLIPNTSYTFDISSKNNQDDSYNTTSSFATNYTIANAAGTPTPSSPGITTIALTLDANSNPAATTYAIYNSTSGNYLDSAGASTSTAVFQTTSTWSGITATGLTANTSYQFTVVARNGNSVNAATSSASTAVYTLANVPSSVAASASGNTITVTFTGDATSYYVVDNADSARYSDYTTTLSREFTGLTCNTSYIFKVKGKNVADTETAYSSTVSATTGACASSGGGAVSSVAPSLPIAIPSVSATTVTLTLTLNTPTPVSIGGVSHTITVSSVTASQITLTIQSEPIKLTLNKGESKDIDTDKDMVNDARIIYLGLVNGKPEIEIVNLTDPTETKAAVSINAGAYETTDSSVAINLNGTNISQIAISNDPSFLNTSFVAYTPTVKWGLTAGNGLKTVYVKFRSNDGGTSSASDTIKLNITDGVLEVVTTPATPSAYKFTKTLYSGNTGIAVKELQKVLQGLGYYTAKTITGKYDAATKTAVIKFQKAKKLTPYPGWVGPATIKALNNY